MTDVESRLRDLLLGEARLDGPRAELMRQEEVRKLDRALARAKAALWAVLVLCVGFGVYCFVEFQRAESVKAMVGYAVLILIMYEGTILMKLWAWVVHTRITLQKELAEIRLLLAELMEARRTEAVPPSGD